MKLVQHVGLIHALEANFIITCGLKDCKSTITSHEPFRCRLHRKHVERVLPESEDGDLNNSRDLDNTDNDLQPGADIPPRMDALLRNYEEDLFSIILKCRGEKNITFHRLFNRKL